MSSVSAVRWSLGAGGVAAGLYGAYVGWTRSDGDQLVSTGLWLGGGVIAHDLVIAAIALVVVGLAARVLPQAARAPAAVALVVLGPLTLIAVPFLGRFGAKDDNATLLNRSYVTGYLVLVGLVLLVIAGGAVARAVRARRGS